ncbi:MAG: FumA C-terminus/TtdB family hydratase beta subunit [Candidatus Omnitrophica bacterium]|nr:FumA C-terminus/TtdB family hydratase beta subunit [Candidatus Omnitrophota bacterium]
MAEYITITTPVSRTMLQPLACGQQVRLNGILYTARDQAHRRMAQLLAGKKKLPFSLENQIIYYCGPNPAPAGRAVGACGPTTSGRMDAFTPALLSAGMAAMVGKGERSAAVIAAIRRHRAVYFATYSGCGALLSQHVQAVRLVCFGDLGTEAVYAFAVRDFPLIVAVDARGGNIYEQAGQA